MNRRRTVRAGIAALVLIGSAGFIAEGPGPAAAAMALCTSHVPGDFNGDGHADLAVRQSPFDQNDTAGVAAVRILYGSATGLSTVNNQYFDGTGFTTAPHAQDGLDGAMATGDFNGDGCADLAIAAPHYNFSTQTDDGYIFVMYGSPAGLSNTDVAAIPESSIVPASVNGDVFFNDAMAAGDFDGDGYDDIVVGANGDAGFHFNGGAAIIYGSPTGLDAPRHLWLTNTTAATGDVTSSSDGFGQAVATGDFNGDGRRDIAIGAPTDIVKSVVAGDVTVLYGSATGITTSGSKRFSEATTGVPGTAEARDQFGASLAAGDITTTGHADLVVGAPGEGIGNVGSAGSITVLNGSPTGITGIGSRAFDQNSAGIPGTAETSDTFGSALTTGDFNGDGHADVAVGVVGEDIGAAKDTGYVNVLYGSASGLTGAHAQGWDQDSAGIGGVSDTGDYFGYSVAALDVTSTTHADLVVGVPGEEYNPEPDAHNGLLNVILGSATKTGLTAAGNAYVEINVLIPDGQTDERWMGLGLA